MTEVGAIIDVWDTRRNGNWFLKIGRLAARSERWVGWGRKMRTPL